MRMRFAATAAVVLALLAGCVPQTTPAPPSPADAEPDPVLLGVGELLDADGALPLDVAQGVFAATVAPLPGVEPLLVAGEAPTHFAGAAARRLDAARAELPAEIVEAVRSALEPAADDVTARSRPGARGARRSRASSPTTSRAPGSCGTPSRG